MLSCIPAFLGGVLWAESESFGHCHWPRASLLNQVKVRGELSLLNGLPRNEVCGAVSCNVTMPSTFFSKLARLEQLEELDLSGNRLRAVPTTILSCQRMHTLAAHSNCISAFPEVLQLPEIKVSLIC